MKTSCLLIVVYLLAPGLSLAQQDMGTITGVVTDPTGGVLPGVTVTARERATGIQRATVTNGAGVYLITPVPIGTYDVEAELQGFRKAMTRELELHAGDRARIDFQLTLGAVTQEVLVSAAPPLLERESSALGQVMETRAIEDLPVRGRNFQTLALLTAGVTPATGHRDQMGGFNANGNRALQNNFLVDGIDNNSNVLGLQNRQAQVLIPSLDAVREFKVSTSNYSAELGRNAGAVMMVTIKSGTNDFRGTAFEYFRHDMFDARDTFHYDDRDGDGKADPEKLRRHQFGGTFGGPIRRNRTFFFGSWDATRLDRGLVDLVTVPTALERQGIFDAARTGRAIRDPLTGRPFPNDTIPSGRIDPVAARLVALYPLPNFEGSGRQNYTASPLDTEERDQLDFRVDHQFSPKDRMFVRYSFMDHDERRDGPFPPPLLGIGGNTRAIDNNVAHSLAASETHIFGPRLVNEFRFGMSRLETDKLPLSAAVGHVNEQFGINGIPRYEDVPGLPQIQLAGAVPYANIGDVAFSPNLKLSQTFHVMDNVTYLLGTHSLKAGGDYRFFQADVFGSAQARGRINFNGRYTGVSLADFLLGWANIADLSTPQPGDLRGWSFAAYVQDDWKATPKLTLNLGVRYELQTPFWEKADRQNNFITDFGHPRFGTFVRAGELGNSIEGRALVALDTNNWAPRVGATYMLTDRTVVRAAAGIFYGGPENVGASSRLLANPPFFVRVIRRGTGRQPAIVLSQGVPADFLGDGETIPRDADVNSWAVDYPVTEINQWTLNVQHELPARMIFSVAYVGNRGKFLAHGREFNLAGIGNPDTEPQRRPFPHLGSINLQAPWAHSNYHSLQAKLDKRFSRGRAFLVSYTWGHALDNAGEPFVQDTGVGTPWDLDNDYASSSFDIRHRFVSSILYELPFGEGRRWLDGGGVTSTLFGAWQINAIVTAQTGLPFTPEVSDSYSHLGTLGVGSWRPDRLRDGSLSADQRSAEQWFDASAFAIPCDGDERPCRQGTAGRNILRSPGQFNIDLSLMKHFRMGDHRLQFRWEAFNLTNTPFLGEPNAVIDNPNVGLIRSTRGTPRQMQFSVRYSF